MKTFDELILVNYCYPDCIPLMNIMRLPQKEAYALASVLAESHPETTAFYRFADFENYYLLRKKQDEYLYSKFIELGGLPEEKHPLSFVELLALKDLKDKLLKYGSDYDSFIKATGKHYVEVQLWTDKYITKEYLIM